MVYREIFHYDRSNLNSLNSLLSSLCYNEINYTCVKDREKEEILDWWNLINLTYTDIYNDENIVLMKYIWFKDKNGAEIYEGDIVAIENSGNWEVIFKLGSFEFFQGDKKISDGYGITPKWEIIDKHGIVEGFEIIGNIYQHPELLQKWYN